MCDKTAANRDVVIRELQATAKLHGRCNAAGQAQEAREVWAKCEEGLERGNVCSTVERQICDSGARIRRDDVGEAGNLGGESRTIL